MDEPLNVVMNDKTHRFETSLGGETAFHLVTGDGAHRQRRGGSQPQHAAQVREHSRVAERPAQPVPGVDRPNAVAAANGLIPGEGAPGDGKCAVVEYGPAGTDRGEVSSRNRPRHHSRLTTVP